MDGGCNVLIGFVQDRHSCLDRLRYIIQRDIFGCLGLLSPLHLALLLGLTFPIATPGDPLCYPAFRICIPRFYVQPTAPPRHASFAFWEIRPGSTYWNCSRI